MNTADRFAEFAVAADRAGSPVYAEWARGVATAPEVVAVIERARPPQRQPVLVFAVARLLGARLGSFDELRSWIAGHADAFVRELDARHTQTNDARRVGPVAAALARILGPVALLEVGASAGLGLFPDHFCVRVGDMALGDVSSDVHVDVEVEGAQDPRASAATLPRVVQRAGLDLAPLDVQNADDMLWLETLLWPGQDDRIDLLRRAVALARRDPPSMLAGDAVDGLDDLVAQTPSGATPVVITSGTLVYLPGARRQAFVDRVEALGVRWISYERTGLLTGVHSTLRDPAEADGWFATLALDGVAVAVGDAHGERLRWLRRREASRPDR